MITNYMLIFKFFLTGEDESFIAHCAAIKTMNFSKIVNKSENAIKNIEYEQ